jgi:D-galactarolactone cycloisomerase
MKRREFLGAAIAGTASVTLHPAVTRAQVGMRAKITDIKLARVKVVRELGVLDNTNFIPGMRPTYRVGGGTIVQVVTDQGLVGFGPGVEPPVLEQIRGSLVGKDPFEIDRHATALRRFGRNGAAAETALWDLIGKLTNQPLYRLWGGAKDSVVGYCSFMTTSTPEERAERSARMQALGWKGVKLRSSLLTMKEDVRVVELIRKTCGDDFLILTDGNKAYGNLATWDIKRATETALAFQALNVYWLEEPLPQYHLEQLAELNAKLEMPLAGGEAAANENEFYNMIKARAYDILNCEVAAQGVSVLRRVQNVGQAFGVSVVPHNGDGRFQTICQMHLVGSWANSPLAEVINEPPIAGIDDQFSVFDEPPVLREDGTFMLPQRPGLGVEIKRDLLTDA